MDGLLDFGKKLASLLEGIFNATGEGPLRVVMLVILKLIGLAEDKAETSTEETGE